MKLTCKHCGNFTFYEEDRGQHKGIYCSKCGKWVKWVNKNDLSALKSSGVLVSKPIVRGVVADDISEQGISVEKEFGVLTETRGNDAALPFDISENSETVGCPVCMGTNLVGTVCGVVQGQNGVLISNAQGINYRYSFRTKFCPHCGRRVVEDEG